MKKRISARRLWSWLKSKDLKGVLRYFVSITKVLGFFVGAVAIALALMWLIVNIIPLLLKPPPSSPSFTFTVALEDEKTGNPIPGASISIMVDDGPIINPNIFRTDDKGRAVFTLPVKLKDQTGRLIIQTQGGISYTRSTIFRANNYLEQIVIQQSTSTPYYINSSSNMTVTPFKETPTAYIETSTPTMPTRTPTAYIETPLPLMLTRTPTAYIETPTPTMPTRTPTAYIKTPLPLMLTRTPTAYIETSTPTMPTRTPTNLVETSTITQINPTETLSVGNLEITYPLEMVVDKDDVVTVEIAVDPKVASIFNQSSNRKGIISIEVHSQDGQRNSVKDDIPIFPVMSADLISSGFDISTRDNNSPWIVTSISQSAAWTWSITPRISGLHKFTINIYGKVTKDDKELATVLLSKTLNVSITEKSLLNRIFDGFISNIPAIVGTGGPLGLIIAFLTIQINRESKKQKETITSQEKTIKNLEERIKELEKPVKKLPRKTKTEP